MRHGRAVMPWGKYKGVRIRLLPDDYLSWLTTTEIIKAEQWRWLRDSLIAELKFRGYNVESVLLPDRKIVVEETGRVKRKFRFD
jgi:uncharacterized protein (DUF3820 family)